MAGGLPRCQPAATRRHQPAAGAPGARRGGADGDPAGRADGPQSLGRSGPRSAGGVLPADPAVGLPAVDRHLVRHRRAEQGAADLPGAVRAAADRYRRRRASRRPIAGAGGALPGGQPLAGGALRDPAECLAGGPHRPAHRPRRRLVDPGRRRADRGQPRPRLHGPVRRAIPRHRRGGGRHPADRRHRPGLRTGAALGPAALRRLGLGARVPSHFRTGLHSRGEGRSEGAQGAPATCPTSSTT